MDALWGALAIIALGVLTWVANRSLRKGRRDFGGVSERWLSEHRAKGPADDRS